MIDDVSMSKLRSPNAPTLTRWVKLEFDIEHYIAQGDNLLCVTSQ